MYRALPATKRTNLWIKTIVIKNPTTLRQVMVSISSQHIKDRFNRIHVITARRYKNLLITNIQENRYIFNKKRHIKVIGGNSFALLQILQHQITFVVLSRFPFRLNVIIQYSQMMRKWENPTKAVHHLYVQGKILRPRISFRFKTTYIDNQYKIYSRTCSD